MPRLRTLWICAGLAASSLLLHVVTGRLEPNEPPPIDMLAYFERAGDSSFLAGDFATDATMQPNPRHVFGAIVLFLARLSDQGWAGALFGLRLVLISLLPVFFFLVCGRLILTWEPKADRARLEWALALGVLLITQVAKLNYWLSVASWPPFNPGPQAQALSTLLALAAAAVLHRVPWAGVTLAAAAALVHPVAALLTLLFALGLRGRENLKWPALGAWLACFVGMVGVALYYRDSGQLGAGELVELYIRQAHDSHFLPSQMASNTRFPGWAHYLAGGFLLVAPWIALTWLKGLGAARVLAQGTILALTLYLGVLAVSWVALEVWQVRIVALIGPLRWVQFWPWAALSLAVLAWSRLPARDTSASADRKQVWAAVLVPSLLFIVIYSVAFRHPYERFQGQAPGLAAWAGTTPKDSLFVGPPELGPVLVLLARRPFLTGLGFTFRESAIPGYIDRLIWAYGDVRSRRILEMEPGQWGSGGRKIYHARQEAGHLALGRQRWGLRYAVYDAAAFRGWPGALVAYQDEDHVVVDLAGR